MCPLFPFIPYISYKMPINPISEDFVFNVSNPVVREKVEELLGHKHESIPKLHMLLANEALTSGVKNFEWMLAMKHFTRELEHLLQEVCIRRRVADQEESDSDSECDDYDPEAEHDRFYQELHVRENPWSWSPVTDADKYDELLQHLIKLHDTVSSHHMYLRDCVYKTKTA